MPDEPVSERARERTHSLVVVCVLALASIVIALVGASPARVSASEALGAERTPGDAAFIASHRGGAATAPENTLPAISAALAAGFDYVEVDVALTADRRPVLMHDATVDRTTDGSGALADLTLAQVRRLDAGSWFAPAFAGTPVPLFDELLDVLEAADGRAIVELKGEWDAQAMHDLVAVIDERALERRITLASFDAATLALAEGESEVIPRLLILKHLPDDVVLAANEAGVRGLIVDAKAVLAAPDVVDALHDAGLRVVVYTLNTDRQWDEATGIGVDGIVTDDPGTLHSWQRAYADR